MPSPFPGMDPWLEDTAIFPDFHQRFINHLSDMLNDLMPPPFYSSISTRVWMEESERRVELDIDVLNPLGNGFHANGSHQGGIALLDRKKSSLVEIVAHLSDEEMSEAFLEIYTSGGEELVTSIEFLSPSNKTPGSGGRDLYRAKQQELFAASVNIVEIDFLRRGTHATLVPLSILKQQVGRFDYHACIHFEDRRDSFIVAPFMLADVLPTIPIPLTAEIAPVEIDLKKVVDRCYAAGAYQRRIHYEQPAEPPLTADQTEWAEKILREKNLLPATSGDTP